WPPPYRISPRPVGRSPAAQPLERLANALRHEHVVRDRGDFLRLPPCPLQLSELPLHRPQLCLFVQRHFEREPIRSRESEKAGVERSAGSLTRFLLLAPLERHLRSPGTVAGETLQVAVRAAALF